MKIAMVSEHACPLTGNGAVSTHVAEMAAALSRLGHEVTVHTRRDDPASPERVRVEEKYEVVRVPAGPARRLAEAEAAEHTGEFAEFLAGEWRLSLPDVVHAHGWTSGLAAVLGAQRTAVPVVQSFHGLSGMEVRHRDAVSEQRAGAERLLSRTASRIIATSSAEVSELSRMGVQRTRISAVPGGVDLELFRPDGPVARRDSPRRIVTVGRLLPHNGFGEIVAALPKCDDAELVIAGDCLKPQTDKLRAFAREMGVEDRVVFAGTVPRREMPALLRSADVVTCTPWHEPFGTVALEAMACGVPVVATAVGALADVVVHGMSGLHVPPRDPRVLTRRLRALLADETRRQEIGIAARDRVVARYSWDRVAGEVLSAYERATAVEKPGRTATRSLA